MKKALKKIVVIFIFCISIFATLVRANSDTEKVNIIEKSETFQKWEELTEEERKDTIQPTYFDIEIKNSIKRSKYNTLLASTETDNTRYNLKDELNKIVVKNQQAANLCWAFSFSSMLETTVAKQYNNKEVEYSPAHMAYKVNQMYNQKLGDGANPWVSLGYVSAGYGPVYEEELKFSDVYSETSNNESSYYLANLEDKDINKAARARVKDATAFANIYKDYSNGTVTYKNSSAFFGSKKYTEEEVLAIRKLIKEQIKEEGAVTAQFYSDMGINNQGEHISQGGYYNKDTKAFYYNGILNANHEVTIVGWDDNFKKENFAEGHQPSKDGAYIVLNSWGEEFGDNGYFYVSYDDAIIEQEIFGINSIQVYDETDKSTLDYDDMYQYDELGMSQAISLTNDAQTQYLSNTYAANVFEKKKENEYLTEVGIFLPATEGVEVYINPSSKDLNINSAKLVASYTGGNALEAGYHTLKISPVELIGEEFAIIIKYINSEGVEVPIECNLLDSNMTDVSTFWDTATSNQGESYISKDGIKWNDMYNFKLTDTYTLKNTNACIKAFTRQPENLPSPTAIELDKSNLTIEIGDKVTLLAKVSPVDAIGDVIWESANSNVAIVENGVVTGKSSGKTTITATTKDGKLKAICNITVTKEEKFEDDIYVDKEEPIVMNPTGENDSTITIQANKNDTTIANKVIPYAGFTSFIILIIVVVLIGTVAFIRYKKIDK